jgi:hypothetical protein
MALFVDTEAVCVEELGLVLQESRRHLVVALSNSSEASRSWSKAPVNTRAQNFDFSHTHRPDTFLCLPPKSPLLPQLCPV